MVSRHTQQTRMHCPFCDELIHPLADSCRYCGQFLTSQGAAVHEMTMGDGGYGHVRQRVRRERPAVGEDGQERYLSENHPDRLTLNDMPWSDEAFARLSRSAGNAAARNSRMDQDKRANPILRRSPGKPGRSQHRPERPGPEETPGTDAPVSPDAEPRKASAPPPPPVQPRDEGAARRAAAERRARAMPPAAGHDTEEPSGIAPDDGAPAGRPADAPPRPTRTPPEPKAASVPRPAPAAPPVQPRTSPTAPPAGPKSAEPRRETSGPHARPDETAPASFPQAPKGVTGTIRPAPPPTAQRSAPVASESPLEGEPPVAPGQSQPHGRSAPPESTADPKSSPAPKIGVGSRPPSLGSPTARAQASPPPAKFSAAPAPTARHDRAEPDLRRDPPPALAASGDRPEERKPLLARRDAPVPEEQSRAPAPAAIGPPLPAIPPPPGPGHARVTVDAAARPSEATATGTEQTDRAAARKPTARRPILIATPGEPNVPPAGTDGVVLSAAADIGGRDGGPGLQGDSRPSSRTAPWWKHLAGSATAQTIGGMVFSLLAFAGLLAALFFYAEDTGPRHADTPPAVAERDVSSGEPQDAAPQPTPRPRDEALLEQRPEPPAPPQPPPDLGLPEGAAETETAAVQDDTPQPAKSGDAAAAGAVPTREAPEAPPIASPKGAEASVKTIGPTRLTPPRPRDQIREQLAAKPGRPPAGDPPQAAPRRSWDEPIRRTLQRIEHAESVASRPVMPVPRERAQEPPIGSATPGPVPVIHRQEDLVRLVQRALDRLGYAPGPIDGKMGNETRRAIVRYQIDRGMSPSGWVDQPLVGRVLAESRAKTQLPP